MTKYRDFFSHHTNDLFQSDFELSDDDMSKLKKYFSEFDEPENLIKKLRRDKGNLDQLAVQVLGRSLFDDQYKDMQNHNRYDENSISVPISLPLSKEMLIEPKYDGRVSLAERNKIAGPAYAVPVSDAEKKTANLMRKKFVEVLKQLERLDRYLLVFFDNVDDLDNSVDISSLGLLLKRYEKKLKHKFTEFSDELEKGLTGYSASLTDTKLDNIRDLIIENTKNMREGMIELFKFFRKVQDPEFLSEVKKTYDVIKSSIDDLSNVIRDQLFTHLDQNILGRLRLGQANIPLSIKQVQ